MKKKKAKASPANAARTPRKRTSLDKKLAPLAPHERTHLLYHDRPNDGDMIDQLVRRWRTVKQLSDQRDNPAMTVDRSFLLVNGEAVKAENLLESLDRLYAEAKKLTAEFAAGAFANWNPDFFTRVAASMRKVSREGGEAFNIFKPSLPFPRVLRLLLLEKSKSGPVNQSKLACEIEGVLDAGNMTDDEAERVESTRKTIGNVCRRWNIKSLRPGAPQQMEN